MKFGWPISLFLHAFFATVGMIAFSNIAELDSEKNVIPVELVTLADITNVKAAIKAAPDISPTETPMTIETPMRNATDEGDSQARSVETFRQDAIDPTPDGDDIIEPEPDPVPKFDLDQMAALVNRTRDTEEIKDQQIAPQSQDIHYSYSDQNQVGIGEGTALTVDETVALQQAMRECWDEPVAAPNPEELAVRVRIQLRKDGHVTNVDSLDRRIIELSNDPFLRAAENEALSAVQECAPYDFLPLKKYANWREIIYTFKPRKR